MKVILILLCFLGTLKAQVFDRKTIKVPYYFDVDTIIKDTKLDVLVRKYAVDQIVYHYSQYRLNPKFDQNQLNIYRKQNLLQRHPSLKSNTILWKDSVNYECKNTTECSNVFHGYTIYFQNGSKLTRDEELSFVDSMMKQLKQVNITRLKKNNKPKYMKSVWDDRVGWVPDTSSSFTIETKESIQSKIPNLINNTIARNNWIECNYVIDITASMSKYYCDFLKNINNQFMDSVPIPICFFNDGNGKENNKKVIGSTGGIYYYEGYNLDKMNKVIKNHLFVSSKDCQENDAEGIIESQAYFSNDYSTIMIADNSSPVRDFNLFRNIKNPVHIILCGANDYNVNPQYLALAYLTNGSIHTTKHDIPISAAMSPGDKFRIGMKTYKFIGIDIQAFPLFERID